MGGGEQAPDGWFTVSEAVKNLGLYERALRKRLSQMVHNGAIETKKYIPRYKSQGGKVLGAIPHYKLK